MSTGGDLVERNALIRHPGFAVAAALAGAAYAELQWLGHTAGATTLERHMELPDDELIEHPMMVTTHAITIDAAPAEIWPWLVQMGWHRGAWYTARWVDQPFFPANAPSADRILPQLQQLAVGDWIPDGPPETGCGFTVTALEPNRHLVLHSTEHLPPHFKDRVGGWIDWTWAFVLCDLGAGRTRFVFRSRVRLGPAWLAAAYRAAIVPADFVMSRQMLHGIRRRATRRAENAHDQEVSMSQPEHDVGQPSPISKPLIHCPTCQSERLETVVESVMQDVHFLCKDCGRCWDVALGTAQRVDPVSCFGCPERGRCARVYAADHPAPSAHAAENVT